MDIYEVCTAIDFRILGRQKSGCSFRRGDMRAIPRMALYGWSAVFKRDSGGTYRVRIPDGFLREQLLTSGELRNVLAKFNKFFAGKTFRITSLPNGDRFCAPHKGNIPKSAVVARHFSQRPLFR